MSLFLPHKNLLVIIVLINSVVINFYLFMHLLILLSQFAIFLNDGPVLNLQLGDLNRLGHSFQFLYFLSQNFILLVEYRILPSQILVLHLNLVRMVLCLAMTSIHTSWKRRIVFAVTSPITRNGNNFSLQPQIILSQSIHNFFQFNHLVVQSLLILENIIRN